MVVFALHLWGQKTFRNIPSKIKKLQDQLSALHLKSKTKEVINKIKILEAIVCVVISRERGCRDKKHYAF